MRQLRPKEGKWLAQGHIHQVSVAERKLEGAASGPSPEPPVSGWARTLVLRPIWESIWDKLKIIHISREKWLSLPVFSLVLPTLKKKMMKGEEKRFIHSFKADVKIPENISNHLSYSLGQVIRPSILIKAPKGQKYLQGGRPEDRTQKGTPKQNKNNPLVFQAFIFCVFFSFFCWCPLGSDAAFDYWYSFRNQPTLVTPVFVLSSTQVEATKPFKAGKKIWIWFTSLYSQLPETQQGSGSTLSSQTDIKCQSPKVLFNTLQESFLGPVPVCPCFKESSSKYGYPVFLPEQSGKSIRKGRRKKGEAYRQHTGSGCCH